MFFAGCQKNGFDTVYAGGDSVVSFVPSVAATESSTKGALINEDGPGTIAFDNTKSFFVTAWDNAEIPSIIIPNHLHTIYNYQEVKMKGSQWNTVYTSGGNEYSQEYIWKSGETKTFFAYSNLPVSGAEMAYVNPVSAGQKPQQQLIVSNLPSTAAKQTDILMGCYYGDGNGTGTAGIVFSHPMTAVKFELGSVVGVSSFEITKISMEGVYSKGTALLTTESAFATLPENRFVWTPDGTTTTVQQSITTQPTTAAPAIGEAFLLIPQTFASDSEARIVVALNDGTDDLTLYYPLASTTWAAGCATTYTIKFTGGSYIIDGPEEYNGSSLGGIPEGAVPGLFSVSSTKQVYFAKGNLQYRASTGTWRFAENQFDFIGNNPGNSTLTGRDGQSEWIDLFGWGATGRNAYGQQPYSTNTNDTDYKTVETAATGETLTRENGGDWGVCIGDGWRTLSQEEWNYMLYTRVVKGGTGIGNTFSYITFNGCCLLVIYPDNYTGNLVPNTCSILPEGFVYLPLAGARDGSRVDTSNFGRYWTATGKNANQATRLYFANGSENIIRNFNRSIGQSVRLAIDAE